MPKPLRGAEPRTGISPFSDPGTSSVSLRAHGSELTVSRGRVEFRAHGKSSSCSFERFVEALAELCGAPLA